MFGSRVEEALRAAGHEVVRDREGAEAIVVDLTADGLDISVNDSQRAAADDKLRFRLWDVPQRRRSPQSR